MGSAKRALCSGLPRPRKRYCRQVEERDRPRSPPARTGVISLPGLGWWEAAQGARPETEDHPMTKRAPNKTRPRARAKNEERSTQRSDIGCGETPERQARPGRGPARTNGRSDDRGTCRCDGLAETFGPRRSEPAPVGGLRHSSGIDGGTEGLSARTGRGVSHVSYGNPHYGKPGARRRRAR